MKVDREESSAAVSSSVVEKTIKKRKRDKKATKSVVIDVEDVAGEEAPAVLATTATGCMVEEVDADASGNDAAKPSSRYIVFVGNLPYGMTEERLRAFLKMDDDLVEVRLPRNEKDRSRTKGYAFCELKTAAARQKCLLYHHTKFEGRRINVEATAGGGGNSAKRKAKIQKKNETVNKWRQRRMEKGASVKQKKGGSFKQ
ncbi:RRM domain-containing protein [Plasmodiophora brassicae]|uniref:RRM domain-containing protein n=1 Tax=Plasmodiophora brassicae TaxID=37360 RepID=A0A0G4IML9_PLABS|nr:hypothetical protein PBRA_005018 [Plasmodiophora brassicae]